MGWCLAWSGQDSLPGAWPVHLEKADSRPKHGEEERAACSPQIVIKPSVSVNEARFFKP